MLTDEEFETVQDAHSNEDWWYLFFNYGCPLIENKEYQEKFDAVTKAMGEYLTFVNQSPTGNEDDERELCL